MKKTNFANIAAASVDKLNEELEAKFKAADNVMTTQPPVISTRVPLPQAAEKPKPVPKLKPEKKKEKVIRDTFSLPFSDYQLIGKIVQRTAKIGTPVNKSEAIRLGLKAVEAMKEADLVLLLQKLEKLRQRKYALPG